MDNVHDDVAEGNKLGFSYRFDQEITDYFISWTVVNCNVLTLLHVCNEEISDVGVSCSFAAWRSSVCFELLATQITLMYFCWPERVSLSLKEVMHPHYGRMFACTLITSASVKRIVLIYYPFAKPSIMPFPNIL